MTHDQLLTWLRQRLPQLEPGQLPDPTIDLHNPNLDLNDPNTLRQVVHAGLTVLAEISPSGDTRRSAADRRIERPRSTPRTTCASPALRSWPTSSPESTPTATLST